MVAGGKQVKKILFIVGPTASGKSALGMRVAQAMNGEIICGDSRTIYRGMDIGTAKPTKADQALVAHHLLDIVDPDEKFSVADFKHVAEVAIDDIRSRGKLPIVVGGSGLYIDSILFDYQFSTSDQERDPVNQRHLRNTDDSDRRTMREDAIVVGLNPDRDVLLQKIRDRAQTMIDDGIVEEVRTLLEKYDPESEAMKGIIYRIFGDVVHGAKTLEQAKEEFIQGDTRLVKKQLTWFKRNPNIRWFTESAEAFRYIQEQINHVE